MGLVLKRSVLRKPNVIAVNQPADFYEDFKEYCEFLNKQ